jgi:hypothetical protein
VFCGQKSLNEFVPLYNNMTESLLFFTFSVNSSENSKKNHIKLLFSANIEGYSNLPPSEDLNKFQLPEGRDGALNAQENA